MGQSWKPVLLLIASAVSAHCTLSTPGPGVGSDMNALPWPVGCPPAYGLGADSCSVPSFPELEMAKARNQLDAVLQCLLEKSHMDRSGPGPA